MDVERTMEFILNSQAQFEVDIARMLAAHDAAAARHDREIAQIREVQARTDQRLDRAVRLAVREARKERELRRKGDSRLDELLTQLAAAQLLTEERLKAYLDSLKPGGNGNQ